MQFDPVPNMQTIDLELIFAVEYIAAYVSYFIENSVQFLTISLDTLFINILGGSVPHPAP